MSPEVKRILLMEPDVQMRERIAGLLGEAGYQVSAAANLDQALAQLGRQHHDAIIAALTDADGRSEVTATLREEAATTPLLVLCDSRHVDSAVVELRRGADDYLLRPPDAFELATRLQRLLERHELDSRITFFQEELSKKYGFMSPEASSPAMRQVLDSVSRVAPMRSTVLIYGESGVGKELVARSIHFSSRRRDHPFIPLNCAAIPQGLIESELFGHEKGSFTGALARVRGKFEIAHRGTLFLDEIGEMDPATQVKLLRVLEEREFMRVGGDRHIRVDVRVIAATNADLEGLVAQNRFRQDLYYRLKVVTIRVPSLRDRRSDIPALARTFVDGLSKSNAIPPKAISSGALAALQDYHWPGNVRELKNLLESMLVSVPGEVIELEHLPAAVRKERPTRAASRLALGMTLAEMEREMIRRTLEETGGNRTHSAALLGIGVRTLQRKIQSFGLSIPPRRRRRRRAEPA